MAIIIILCCSGASKAHKLTSLEKVDSQPEYPGKDSEKESEMTAGPVRHIDHSKDQEQAKFRQLMVGVRLELIDAEIRE